MKTLLLVLVLIPLSINAQPFSTPSYSTHDFKPQDYTQQNLRVQQLQQESKLNNILNNIERDRVKQNYERLQSQAQELIRRKW